MNCFSKVVFKRNLLLGPAIIAFSTVLAGSALAQSNKTDTASPKPAAAAEAGRMITGFRSVTFGMTEDQVKAQISKDFKLPASAIHSDENTIQRTEVLSVSVPDLISKGGTAEIGYVFGYQTHKLITINILWSKDTDPKITADQIYQNGQYLQQYFAGDGFLPQRSLGNAAWPGGVLLFRTSDTDNNVIMLVMSGSVVKVSKNADKGYFVPQALSLVYAADPEHADVYRLTKGSF